MNRPANEVSLIVGSPVMTPLDEHHVVLDIDIDANGNEAYLVGSSDAGNESGIWYSRDALRPSSWLSPTGKPTPKFRGHSITTLVRAQALHNEAQSVLRSAMEMLQSVAEQREEALKDALVDELIRASVAYHGIDIAIGFHNCGESPILVCVYDQYKDPSHDDCLICGEPEERK